MYTRQHKQATSKNMCALPPQVRGGKAHQNYPQDLLRQLPPTEVQRGKSHQTKRQISSSKPSPPFAELKKMICKNLNKKSMKR